MYVVNIIKAATQFIENLNNEEYNYKVKIETLLQENTELLEWLKEMVDLNKVLEIYCDYFLLIFSVSIY